MILLCVVDLDLSKSDWGTKVLREGSKISLKETKRKEIIKTGALKLLEDSGRFQRILGTWEKWEEDVKKSPGVSESFPVG